MALRDHPRSTVVLGSLAAATTVAVVALEYAHVWRRGRAPLPSETDRVIEASREAALETVEVAVAGYQASPARETALLNLLISYAVTFALARASTHLIRAHGRFGPLGNIRLSNRHIHHFVPGIIVAFLSGGASIVSRKEGLDKWMAVPFGAGVALVFDEAALLIELEDVYWTEEGVLSVQVALAALAVLGALPLGLRLLRRGEEQVLEPAVAVDGDR